jgi:hypothetical protein
MISGWKGAIKGCLIGFGVINGGRICYLDQMEDLEMKKKVLRRLSEKKVPVCLRSIFPFVVNNDGFVFDFLSFSNSNLLASFKSGIISISYCLKNK